MLTKEYVPICQANPKSNRDANLTLILIDVIQSQAALSWWDLHSIPIPYGILVVTVVVVFLVLQRKRHE